LREKTSKTTASLKEKRRKRLGISVRSAIQTWLGYRAESERGRVVSAGGEGGFSRRMRAAVLLEISSRHGPRAGRSRGCPGSRRGPWSGRDGGRHRRSG